MSFYFLNFVILDVFSLTVQTEENIIITQEDDRIYLNCTYQMESDKEKINNNKIKWKNKIENTFKDIAVFSPPGGDKPFIGNKMKDSYSNRTELIAPNTSLSAVLIIKDPVCSDNGIYQCFIESYMPYSSEIIKTSRSVVVFHGKYILFHFNIILHVYFLFNITKVNEI